MILLKPGRGSNLAISKLALISTTAVNSRIPNSVRILGLNSMDQWCPINTRLTCK